MAEEEGSPQGNQPEFDVEKITRKMWTDLFHVVTKGTEVTLT
jgi:hypothetical protein